MFPNVKEELAKYVTVQLYIDYQDAAGKRPFNEILKNKYKFEGAIPIYAIEKNNGQQLARIGGRQSVSNFRDFLQSNLKRALKN